MMNDESYMRDPMAKTVNGFIEALEILARYMKDGKERKFFCGAEHDEIYFYTENGPDELSDDGVRLSELGFHFEEDAEGWVYFT